MSPLDSLLKANTLYNLGYGRGAVHAAAAQAPPALAAAAQVYSTPMGSSDAPSASAAAAQAPPALDAAQAPPALDAAMEAQVDWALSQLDELARFAFRVCALSDLPQLPAFLRQPSYGLIGDYLPSAQLFVATLGFHVDRKIQALSAVDVARMVVLNAAANAYLDLQVQAHKDSDQVLFCPGYSGTSFADVQEILRILEARKYVGIYTSDAGMMIPEKSVAGLLLRGYSFTCKGCLIQSKCDYLKQKTTCYAT